MLVMIRRDKAIMIKSYKLSIFSSSQKKKEKLEVKSIETAYLFCEYYHKATTIITADLISYTVTLIILSSKNPNFQPTNKSNLNYNNSSQKQINMVTIAIGSRNFIISLSISYSISLSICPPNNKPIIIRGHGSSQKIYSNHCFYKRKIQIIISNTNLLCK